MTSSRVFIAHSTEDREFSLKIAQDLQKYNIESWICEEHLEFSQHIAERIRSEISQCDHLLVILSEAACASRWVAWELGYALELRAIRGEFYPSIVGVLADRTRSTFTIQPLVFGDNQPSAGEFRFSDVRNYTASNEYEITQLAQQLTPNVTFISQTDGREGELLRESFKCYEKLFPVSSERNLPADIQNWIEEWRLAPQTAPWQEVYGVLHLGGLVVGMAYVTSYPARHWSFGNYFGVRRLWRSNNGSTAEWFRRQLDEKLHDVDPDSMGMVFEVEPVDLTLLENVARRGRITGYADTPLVLANLRQLRRLNLYQQRGALALLSSDGRALPYWQPAMDDDLRPENQRELILMVRLAAQKLPGDIQLASLLDFIYNDLYGDAYSGSGSVSIPEFRPYVQSIRSRVMQAAANGWMLGHLNFRGSIRALLNLARSEDLVTELDL